MVCIKELRERMRIKQSDLAQMLNVSQATLSNWEKGKHDPNTDELLKLSDIFNVSVDVLLGKKIDSLEKESNPRLNRVIELLSIFDELNDEEKSRVIDHAVLLKNQNKNESNQ